MRERDRPEGERVSVLDRPPTIGDRLAVPLPNADGVDLATVRLALHVDGCRVYIASNTVGDHLYEGMCDAFGAGASGGPRSTLVTQGARVCWSIHAGRTIAYGLVSDAVLAVRVGEIEAVLGSNAYMAKGPGLTSEVVLTTAQGERVVPLPPLLRDRLNARLEDSMS